MEFKSCWRDTHTDSKVISYAYFFSFKKSRLKTIKMNCKHEAPMFVLSTGSGQLPSLMIKKSSIIRETLSRGYNTFRSSYWTVMWKLSHFRLICSWTNWKYENLPATENELSCPFFVYQAVVTSQCSIAMTPTALQTPFRVDIIIKEIIINKTTK